MRIIFHNAFIAIAAADTKNVFLPNMFETYQHDGGDLSRVSCNKTCNILIFTKQIML